MQPRSDSVYTELQFRKFTSYGNKINLAVIRGQAVGTMGLTTLSPSPIGVPWAAARRDKKGTKFELKSNST